MNRLLVLFVLAYSYCSLAQVVIGPVVGNQVIKPVIVKNYIPVKKQYRQMVLSELPMVKGEVDVNAVVVGSVAVELDASYRAQLERIVAALKANRISRAQRLFGKFIKQQRKTATTIDLDVVIGSILNELYLKNSGELYLSALYLRNVKQERVLKLSYLADLKKYKNSCAESQSCLVEQLEQADFQISELKAKLKQLDESVEIGSLKLHSTLQKTSQTINTISNVSKVLHDVAMATIRKVG